LHETVFGCQCAGRGISQCPSKPATERPAYGSLRAFQWESGGYFRDRASRPGDSPCSVYVCPKPRSTLLSRSISERPRSRSTSILSSQQIIPRASATAHRPYSVCRVSSHPAACMTPSPAGLDATLCNQAQRRSSTCWSVTDAAPSTVTTSWTCWMLPSARLNTSRVAWIVSCRGAWFEVHHGYSQ